MRTTLLAVSVVLSASCGNGGSTGGSDAQVIADMNARFAKMGSTFDAAVPACTDGNKIPINDLMFNWRDIQRAGHFPEATSPDASWIDSNGTVSRLTNDFNTTAQRAARGREIAARSAVVVKIISIVRGTLALNSFDPGTVKAKAVTFDRSGTPVCAKDLTATNSSQIIAHGTNITGTFVPTDAEKQLEDDLKLQFSNVLYVTMFSQTPR